MVGADWRIETIVDPGAQPEGAPTVTRRHRRAADGGSEPGPDATATPETPDAPPTWAADEGAVGPGARPAVPRAAAAREAIQQTRADGRRGAAARRPAAADAERSRDDLDADTHGLGGEDLLARELGAQMIEEIKHS